MNGKRFHCHRAGSAPWFRHADGVPRPGREQSGVALILVLAILVLVTGITLAFFSRSLLQRQVAGASTANVKVDLLASSAEAMLVSDILAEIEAGSEVDSWSPGGVGDQRKVYRPIRLTLAEGTAQEPPVRAAPSMIPQSSEPNLPASVLKVSRSNRPFFTNGDGYRAAAGDGTRRASGVSTTQSSSNGRSVLAASWNDAGLMTPAEFATRFSPPDWIYLNRRGATPSTFAETMRNGLPENEDFVLGRFAYVIYEVGGLLDINVVGNTLNGQDDNTHRGRLHQVSLAQGVGELDAALFSGFANFVGDWRSPASSGDLTALFDPARSFMDVPEGDQALVNRQDLVRYVRSNGGLVPEEVLPYLSIFTREVNAPYWEPDPDRARNPDDADSLNPNLLSIRFPAEQELDRGGDPKVTVPAGTPVMPRRFPLSKLGLLENYTPAMADAVRHYFGLASRGRQIWEYVDGIDETDGDGNYSGTRIARLNEVAELGREPNFFEVLQAVIQTDSLGKHASDAQSFSELRDALRNLHVLQIGANIIDQWDADDIPTTVQFPSGDPAQPELEVYGTENLPYFNNLATVPFRPTYNRDLFQVWLLFDLWNPHQNAFRPPVGVGQNVRVVASAQEGSPPFIRLHSWLSFPPPTGGQVLLSTGYAATAPVQSLWWDQARSQWPESFTVPAFIPPGAGETGYLEPREVTVGGGRPQEPTSPGSTPPGLLLVEYDLRNQSNGLGTRASSAAIPAKTDRSRNLQIELNGLLDGFAFARYDAEGAFSNNPSGERLYPAGARLRNVQAEYWACEPPLPPPEDGWSTLEEPTRVYARFPAQHAYNHLQFRSGDMDLELQVLVEGEWRTYQKIEGWNGTSGNRVDKSELFRTKDEVDDFLGRNTQHSQSNSDLTGSFYTWRKWFNTTPALTTIEWGGVVQTLPRLDPRSSRFGLSMALIDGLGSSARNASGAWNRVATNGTGWMVTRGRRTGFITDTEPNNGFASVSRISNQPHFGSAIAGVATNHPTELSGNHPLRYSDRDGVIRPGDAYWGAMPTLIGRASERPVILNRPFRSVGDLGYAFRDLPWRTLDFSSRYSADLGLLDFFSLSEAVAPDPVVAGKVNLNTAGEAVLSVILSDSAEQLAALNPGGGVQMTQARARDLARSVVAEREQNGPFYSVGDLITRVLHPAPAGGGPLGSGVRIKAEREAAVRTLAEIGNLRTWNLMIDLVVQEGRLGNAATSFTDFQVRGQRRYWIHLAVDRITGEVVETRREVVQP